MLSIQETQKLNELLEKQKNYQPLSDERFLQIEAQNDDGWMKFNELFHYDFNDAWQEVVKYAQRWGKLNHELISEIRYLKEKIKSLEEGKK